MTNDHKCQTESRTERGNATSDVVEGVSIVDQTIDRTPKGDFLDHTISVWQPYTDRSLTREDAREMIHNVVGFFRILREWAEEERCSTGLTESSPLQPQISQAQPDSGPRKESARMKGAR
ncbi:hypothetical protein [Bradyrhizobium iriomotense]|uniref:Uncharacterized protein n=1 Tax=Bradyrhizobium iriomotense TaxID=441950 RepID=A0ABQ6B5U9_9BRAD|nr:hypothetical protein [Bradyrhizobium iriomotense]GLR89750.1 hypothetical protein GCM10007857_64640 [Bradyrhizobium iriomotense]